MSQAFIGEIVLFAGTFAPRNWAFCDGQIMSIQQNAALFSILGTTYGGNGQTTFALPDLRGRVPLGPRQGPGLSSYVLGEAGGEESHALTTSELPAHTHTAQLPVSSAEETTNRAERGSPAKGGVYGPPDVAGPGVTVATAGSNVPHNNLQPHLALNYIICLFGIFPSRN
ncbi:MAG: Tail Collar domain protein [Frankiales bacterium]|jgi:microcystin-dependent protein|nr:Tail Collar domain protein [Frankiales bacterium]